ncbi:MAG: hypothetical protein IJO32_06545 [Bacilli bacterium]|nr:hypothetical protein [Bacilli bacterium]MBQ7141141.1 hypothetical protein [Bacilli bacterium]
MSNNNSKIYNRFSMLSIIILIVMIVMVAGLSYAYIIKKIEGGDNTRVIIKTADIMLKYDEGNTLNAYNVSPGWEDEFTFSVENYSPEVNAKYKIILDILSPLSEKEDESFIYTLVSKSNKDNSEVNAPVNVDETSVPISTSELGIASISAETLHEYTLNVKLKENNKNQNHLMGKTFIAKIVVETVY